MIKRGVYEVEGLTGVRVSYRKFRNLMKDYDMSKIDVARATGTTLFLVNTMYNDTLMVNLVVLMKMCKLFDCKFNDLVDIIYE